MNEQLKQARWIWAKDYDCPNMFLVARAPCPVPGNAAGTWTLHISVDSDFALWCERDQTWQCVAFGQYPDYAAHKVYETRNISCDLIAGGHLYLVLTSQNHDSSTDRRERAGVIFSLSDHKNAIVWHSDDQTELYLTDRHHDRNVPLITGQLGFTFDIDLCAPLCGTRAQTEVLTDMPLTCTPRPIAPLVLGDAVPSRLIRQAYYVENTALPAEAFGLRIQSATLLDQQNPGIPADGICHIYDLSAEQVGFLTLDIEVSKDCSVLIGWGEHLADGHVRASVGGRCFAARCRMKKGRNFLLYPFRRLGLRYLQLHMEAAAGDVIVHYAGVRSVDYPLPAAKPCPLPHADDLDLAIYRTGLRTLRLCLHDHYEDCPWREQALYTMDSRNQMLCGYYAFGETAAPRASLYLMAQSLREDHLLELCSPARCSITIPSFSAMFVVQLEEYATFTKDLVTARELLPTARSIVDGFLAQMDAKTGLLTCYPLEKHWNFYEWQDGLAGSISGSVKPEDMTYDAPLCCFVSLALGALSRLYRMLQQADESDIIQRHQIQLNQAIHAAFYNEADGVYDSYIRLRDGMHDHRAQLTLSLAILCGACPADQLNRAREHLAYDKTLYPVTLSHSIFRYDALLADSSYLPLAHREIREQFGFMLQAGATTFWETLQGESDFDHAGSLCHGWSAIPVYIDWKYGQ